MSAVKKIALSIILLIITFSIQSCSKTTREIERPEKIFSKRYVYYDADTYSELANLWQKYFDQFPSEDAYANWMYAARYAGWDDYQELLDKGVKKYPANPTLLYLKGMCSHGTSDNLENLRYLEKAVDLEPEYMDPWTSLVIHYMQMQEFEKMDVALRKLLEGNAFYTEVMDYSYNMFASMEKYSILITNGDNDTYPGWILTRILEIRPDITIINRSLLNTDWYPGLMLEMGAPKFITNTGVENFRDSVITEYKNKGEPVPSYGPFGDLLIERIIKAAEREYRAVYFASTLGNSKVLDKYRESGVDLGLVTLVTPGKKSEIDQLKNTVVIWTNDFKTSGLDSWRIRYAREAEFSRKLALNYAAGIANLVESLGNKNPEYRLLLFNWYQTHLSELMPEKYNDTMNELWCEQIDIKEIRAWCKSQGLVE